MKPVETIRHSSRRLVRELHLLDGKHSVEGFSFSECHLLIELDAMGNATAGELAERLVLDKSTMSRLVNGMRRRGQLVAGRDPSDRRRRQLRLTGEGRRAVARLHRHARRQVANALDYVAASERAALSEGLAQYANALRLARLGADYRLRTLRRRDNEAVARIIRTVMTEFGAVGCGFSIQDPEVDDMYAHYRAPRSRFFVIEKRGEVLGCGGIAPLAGGEPDTCELRKMYFLAPIRGLGLGTRLLNRCLDEARQAGFRRCYLETLGTMDAARRLYLRHGFRNIEAAMGHTGHTGCNNWMIREL